MCKLVGRGKGLRGVREDADFSVEVCADLVVGTNGVPKGQDQRGTSGRHMDSLGTREERGGAGKLLGIGWGDGRGTERKRLIARANSYGRLRPNIRHSPLDTSLQANTGSRRGLQEGLAKSQVDPAEIQSSPRAAP